MFPWYDSKWLERYATARRLLSATAPAVLDRFERDMAVFRTRPDFRVQHLRRVLDDETWGQVHATIAALGPAELEMHEAKTFGRFVAHNLPFFSSLHRRLVPLVSECVGEAVEPTYNFLSLYGSPGVCPPHMDAPSAKWTLDLCVAQSAPWPIYFSQVVPWPEEEARPSDKGAWVESVKTAPSLRFESFALEPGEAVVFSGSSQWHYRDRMPDGRGKRFCDLLFFHFVPAGARDLVRAERWAQIYEAPALQELCDVAPDEFI